MPNVVMIVIDTVRSDFLGFHGGDVATPGLDRLAGEAVDFTNMRAASFPTVPARADYTTGVYALLGSGWGPLPRELTTVAEVATAAGIATAGVADTPFYTNKGFNLDRGFSFFYDMKSQRITSGMDTRSLTGARLMQPPIVVEADHPAPKTFTTAEQWLEGLVDRQPFFLLVDTWGPHEPWIAPKWYGRRYKPDYDDAKVPYPPYGRYQEHGLSDDDFQTILASYKGELEMADRWMGRFLDRLDALGLADDTVVIATADHGFYLGERGGLVGKMVIGSMEEGRKTWGRSPLYDEVARVPLLVRMPGVEARTDDRLVSAIDLAPTVLDLLGLEKPEQMVGRSFAGAIGSNDGAAARDVAITAMPLATPGAPVAVVDDIMRTVGEWQPITVATNEWTMLFSRWSDPIELYDAGNDPRQENNVAADHPDVVEQLHGLMVEELRRGGISEADLEPRMAR
jgi:arylsulfatase A-like enzyme